MDKVNTPRPRTKLEQFTDAIRRVVEMLTYSTEWEPISTDQSLPHYRAIYIGGKGDVEAIDQAGNTVVFKAVPAGQMLDINPSEISSANTTATNLVGLK